MRRPCAALFCVVSVMVAACSASSDRPSTPSTTVATTTRPAPKFAGWDSIVATKNGAWTFVRSAAGGPRLARLDPATGAVAHTVSGRDAPIDFLDTELDGVVWGHQRASRESSWLLVGFDHETLRKMIEIPLPEAPIAFAAGSGALWLAGQHTLYQVHPRRWSIVRQVAMRDALPITALAVAPTNGRLYVGQYGRSKSAGMPQMWVSVRSAGSGKVLVGGRVVGSPPGTARLAANDTGVWVSLPTGMLGRVAKYSPTLELVDANPDVRGTNGINVLVDGGAVLVDPATGTAKLSCIAQMSGDEVATIALPRDTIPSTATTANARVYVLLSSARVGVVPRPAECDPRNRSDVGVGSVLSRGTDRKQIVADGRATDWRVAGGLCLNDDRGCPFIAEYVTNAHGAREIWLERSIVEVADGIPNRELMERRADPQHSPRLSTSNLRCFSESGRSVVPIAEASGAVTAVLDLDESGTHLVLRPTPGVRCRVYQEGGD